MLSASLQIRVDAEIELRRRGLAGGSSERDSFVEYQSDPYRFCVEKFGEYYTDDVRRIMESVRDNTVTIVRSANGTGKSHSAARIAAWFYKCHPGAKVFTAAAPPERNLKIFWGELYALISKHSGMFSEDAVKRDMLVARNDAEFIMGLTIPQSGNEKDQEEKFNGRHAPYLLFIVDEANAVPEAVYKGIEACMSGGHARLLLMFNPRSERGPMPRMEKQRAGHVCQISAFTHPNVITGKDIIPGAVTQSTTIKRINIWSRPLAAEEKPGVECFEVPDFLVGLSYSGNEGKEIYPPLPAGWRKGTEPAIYYMVLGRYPPQAENQLISRVWIDAAVSRWRTYVALHGEIPPVPNAIVGFDVAGEGGDWNQLCFRFGGFVAKMIDRWKGMDVDESALRAADKIKTISPDTEARVDATGLGSSIAPRMRRQGVKATGINVANSPSYKSEQGEFYQLRDELWWSCREWLRTDPGAMLPDDEDLIEELATPAYWTDNIKGKIRVTDKKTMREILGRSPDKADALNMTFAPRGVGGWAR